MEGAYHLRYQYGRFDRAELQRIIALRDAGRLRRIWRKAENMAAPQFSTFPSRDNRGQTRRLFTLEEANRSLPLVARIVRDIVNTHALASQLQEKLDESPAGKEAAATRARLQEVLSRLQDYVDELTAVGAALKDYDMGLIDFPSQHQGREVYLCWKLGEEQIGYWHELHTGFAGRQPVSVLEEPR